MAQIILDEGSAASTPSTGKATIYVKTDGKVYSKDDAGTEYDLTSSGGAGDVVGPASSTNNSLARFDGTTGKLLKDGAVIGTDVAALSANTFTGLQTIPDTLLEIVDDGDATKKFKFQASGITTATTRTATVPDADFTLAGINIAQNYTLPQRSAILTDNDGSFDLGAKQNFKCTPTGPTTLTFTNQADGLSGSVLLVNGSNYAISAHANTKINASDLTTLSVSGTYRVDYLSDGTDAFCTISRNLA